MSRKLNLKSKNCKQKFCLEQNTKNQNSSLYQCIVSYKITEEKSNTKDHKKVRDNKFLKTGNILIIKNRTMTPNGQA